MTDPGIPRNVFAVCMRVGLQAICHHGAITRVGIRVATSKMC